MKALQILIAIMLTATAIGPIFDDCFAETRTLRTTLYITVRPAVPQVAGAPAAVNEILAGALKESRHEQFARMDKVSAGGIDAPCYTMMEKL